MKNEESNISGNRLIFPVDASNVPSGGRKFIYQVVDMLNEAGFDAWVVHPRADFRLTWFENKTRVGYAPGLTPEAKKSAFSNFIPKRRNSQKNPLFNSALAPKPLEVGDSDIIVLAETKLWFLPEMPANCRKIIFNQGPHLTFKREFPQNPMSAQELFGPKVIGMVAASEFNYGIQTFMFPEMKIEKVQYFIEDIFSYQETKKTQIAYMPRRGNDATVVLNMLKLRENDIPVVQVNDMNQQEVAEALKESLIFLSFSEREGFGLPSAEAMACGCIVIGYHGNGGMEFFDPSYCFPIQVGDIKEFVKTIESALEQNLQDSAPLNRMRLKASQTILERYSMENAKKSILQAFENLLKDI